MKKFEEEDLKTDSALTNIQEAVEEISKWPKGKLENAKQKFSEYDEDK